jgi:glycosyltransferase involved in cell wall biosynthesis
MKKILLSVYACEPNKGSEPGVGWKWALELSKDVENIVHIITRANNKAVIENYWKLQQKPENLFFHYYDLPSFWIWIKRKGFPVNLYYSLWQYGILKLAKQLHKEFAFDMVHHLTFGVFRDVSYLYMLKIPFVFGPVGGGDYTPKTLVLYEKKYQFIETVRKNANTVALLNPFLHKMFAASSLILTKTSATKNLIPSKWHYKTYNKLEIGVDSVTEFIPNNRNRNTFLYIGRFIYLKGIDLLLTSFKNYLTQYDSSAQLYMIGEGDYKLKIERFAKKNNIDANIKIIPWMRPDKLKIYYETATAFVFPSLHDSSGNVVLEALSFGLPVICLDCGGPSYVMGNNLKETVISVQNKTAKQIVCDIAEKMHQIVSDENFYNETVTKSIQRARELLWSKTVNDIYDFIISKI